MRCTVRSIHNNYHYYLLFYIPPVVAASCCLYPNQILFFFLWGRDVHRDDRLSWSSLGPRKARKRSRFCADIEISSIEHVNFVEQIPISSFGANKLRHHDNSILHIIE